MTVTPELIERALNGDNTAFRAIRNEVRSCYYIGRLYDPSGLQTKDDMDQLRDIGIWNAMKEWKPDGGKSFRSWAFLCIRREILAHVPWRRVSMPAFEPLTPLITDNRGKWDQDNRATALRLRLLSRMKRTRMSREIFALLETDHRMPYPEIAEELGTTRSTVATLVCSYRKVAKECL